MLPSLFSMRPSASGVVGCKSCHEIPPLRLYHHSNRRFVVRFSSCCKRFAETVFRLLQRICLYTSHFSVSMRLPRLLLQSFEARPSMCYDVVGCRTVRIAGFCMRRAIAVLLDTALQICVLGLMTPKCATAHNSPGPRHVFVICYRCMYRVLIRSGMPVSYAIMCGLRSGNPAVQRIATRRDRINASQREYFQSAVSPLQVARALFPTPILDTRKLTVSYMSAEASAVEELKKGQPRRYNLNISALLLRLRACDVILFEMRHSDVVSYVQVHCHTQ